VGLAISTWLKNLDHKNMLFYTTR